MIPTISIGELQKKTSQFRSRQPFFIRDNRKKTNISFVIPVDGEENLEFIEEAKKLYKKFYPEIKNEKRVFPIFSNAESIDLSLADINNKDVEIENEMTNTPLFPQKQ